MPISMSRVIGARRVVGVQRREHEVAGERRLDRDLRRLVVADLTDQHDVGVGRRIERSALANVRPAFGFTCTWLMPAMRYSTGSSTVMTLISGLRDRVQRRVERRRLARTGRAGDEDHAVAAWRSDSRYALEVARREAQVAQVERSRWSCRGFA